MKRDKFDMTLTDGFLYSFIGLVAVCIVGIIVSVATKPDTTPGAPDGCRVIGYTPRQTWVVIGTTQSGEKVTVSVEMLSTVVCKAK